MISQNYELAFHINPNIEEADVQKTKGDIENLITLNKGNISFTKDPEKIKLAYPIKHLTNSYFGYFHFNMEDKEGLMKIKNQVNLDPNVLRHLMIKFESEQASSKDVVRKMAMKERKKIEALRQRPLRESKEPKASDKEIEKKLEDIIEKI